MHDIHLSSRYRLKKAIKRLNPFAYYPFNEVEGAVAKNHARANLGSLNGAITGATLGKAGKAGRAFGFDGISDFVDIYSSAFNTAFDPTKGTLFAFIKVPNVGVWNAAAQFITILRATSTYQIYFYKKVGGSGLTIQYQAGGPPQFVPIATNTLNWFMVGITWDKVADEVKVYFNGPQTGSTQTGMGVWSGDLSSTETVIGAENTTPDLGFEGDVAHVAVFDKALSAGQMLKLARIAGLV